MRIELNDLKPGEAFIIWNGAHIQHVGVRAVGDQLEYDDSYVFISGSYFPLVVIQNMVNEMNFRITLASSART